LTDLKAHCNALNIELQGKDKTITQFVSSLSAFRRKLQFLESQLGMGILKNFPNLEKVVENYDESRCTDDTFCTEVQNLWQELKRRFQDIKQLDPILVFMSDLEEEILKLQCDIPLKARASEKKFGNLLHEEEYSGFRSIALRLTAFFGSTYLCEAAFSQMKIIKSRYRSRQTDEHLKFCLHL
jgi:hypothetical protein